MSPIPPLDAMLPPWTQDETETREGEEPGSLNRGEAGLAHSLLPHPASFHLPTMTSALTEGRAEHRRAQGGQASGQPGLDGRLCLPSALGTGTVKVAQQGQPAPPLPACPHAGSSSQLPCPSAQPGLGHAGCVLAHASRADTLA